MKAVSLYRKKHVAEDGSIIEVRIWKVPVTPDRPEGMKYSLVYVRHGKRLVGYDNAERQGHHRHLKDTVKPYVFRGIRRLFRDFHRDIVRLQREESR